MLGTRMVEDDDRAALAPRLAFYRLDEMSRGWFVGDFEPTALRTDAAEVAVQRFRRGESHGRHLHRVATEVTVVLQGDATIEGRRVGAGDVIVTPPGVAVAFSALTDVVTVVVKVPSTRDDKFPVADAEAVGDGDPHENRSIDAR